MPAAVAGPVDVGARRDDLLADARGCGRERPAAGVAVHRADGRRPSPVASGSGGASRSGTASTARSRTGSNATTVASMLGAVRRRRRVVSLLTGDHVRVGDDEAGRRDPAAALLDLAARVTGHLHDRLPDARVDRRGHRRGGRLPRVGRFVEAAERGRVRRVGDRAAPRREAGGLLGRGARRWRRRWPSPRAMRAGQPFAAASDGMIIHTSTSTPTTPTSAPAIAVPPGQRSGWTVRPGARACRPPRPSAWPIVHDEDEEEHRDGDAVVGVRAAERRDDASARSARRSRGRPRRRPTRTARATKPESPAADPRPIAATTIARSSRFTSPGGQQTAACVRKPVCATIRWSGRIDWPSTCQLRCSTSSDSTIPNGDAASSSRRRPTCRIVGQVREQDAAGSQRLRPRASPPATAPEGRARRGRGRARSMPS